MAGILIHDGAVLTVNDDREVFEPGFVLIEGDRITEVGEGAPPSLNVSTLLENYARAEGVETEIFDGRVLMRGGKMQNVDDEALMTAHRETKHALWKRAGVL